MARCSVLLAILGSLASCGSASAQRTSAICGPVSGRTLGHSAQARVYVQNRTVFGCVRFGLRQVRLGSTGLCPGSAHLGPVAVAGKVAAYGSRTCGVDTASAQVIVRRLSDGRVLSSHGATEAPPGPESFQSVDSIVVRRNGAVGWIGSWSSIVTHGSVTEVLKWSAGAVRRLDAGAAIHAGSLRLRGTTLTWDHGRERRSARLV